jgi:hypothetical protein
VVIILVWGVVLYRLLLRLVSPFIAYVALLLTWTFTNFDEYVYVFGADIASAALGVLVLLCLLDDRPFRAGLVWGLAIWTKVVNVLFGPLVGVWALAAHRRRRLLGLALGAAGPLLVVGLLQWRMFGSPLTSGYDRILGIDEQGRQYTESHREHFGQPLLEGMLKQLVDPDKGLAATAPLVLLSLPGLWLLWRRHRPLGAAVIYLYVAYYLFFSKYEGWYQSFYGNRFLMIPMALSALPTALLLERLQGLLGARGASRRR